AAEAVCALSEVETLDWLTLLRDSSLIGVVDTEEGLRFTLLETIREYSQEKLIGSDDYSAVHHRHRDHFLFLAEQAEAELEGPEQAMWLDRLETEHDNLRAALDWSLEAGERKEAQPEDPSKIEGGLRLAGALSQFWYVRGDYNEGRGYLERALGREGAQEA